MALQPPGFLLSSSLSESDEASTCFCSGLAGDDDDDWCFEGGIGAAVGICFFSLSKLTFSIFLLSFSLPLISTQQLLKDRHASRGIHVWGKKVWAAKLYIYREKENEAQSKCVKAPRPSVWRYNRLFLMCEFSSSISNAVPKTWLIR